MNNNYLIRYSRQILLEEIGIEGQQKLTNSRVLIVGLGGLGAPASIYLAGAGIGTLVLIDNDEVHLSDLQRQILFSTEDINKPKVETAKYFLQKLNPEIHIISLKKKLSIELLNSQILLVDLVLDCTDNIATRQIINAACVTTNTPLITASAIGFDGQIMVLTPPWSCGCYRCIWPDDIEPQYSCRTFGVIGPIVGIMGTLQALEAIMLLIGIDTHRNQLKLFNARVGNWRQIKLKRAVNCSICGG